MQRAFSSTRFLELARFSARVGTGTSGRSRLRRPQCRRAAAPLAPLKPPRRRRTVFGHTPGLLQRTSPPRYS
ncbi:MAG: hypothetical protein BJ554DRAFT_7441 [Olpidium bornovanus]|uniref:Uncharacterized protein n=1 Tax=Olpidium bornovanus TaxID=278681 RepID=A0A8H8DJF4_9FUNG|nr:MAG: hypothetical protein BJ554DRAFT_7441 [Olpidium bornovanus]